MRHVVVMTLTGSAGLVFMFLVDVATLFWVSKLGVERYMAALGFAWTIQFFTISTGIGLMIATVALISRAVGQGRIGLARRQASAALVYNMILQVIIAGAVVSSRHEILAFAGAEGETAKDAAQYLLISVPSLPLIALGMIGSAVLRSIGDACRSMFVTMSAGLVAVIVDPVLIFTAGLGFDGAAWGIVMSRFAAALIGLWFVRHTHDMLGQITRDDVQALLRPFAAIAIPAIATQLATPFGNYILTRVFAAYGDGAVAGWAVVSRVAVLAFGGIFSLSGAIGGIIGQNYGAGHLDRVRRTFIDALIFCGIYTAICWATLALFRYRIVGIFGLEDVSGDVMFAFLLIGSSGYMFSGAIFVSNAAFNNLGRPLNSALCNWLRDGVLMLPCTYLLGRWLAAPGVVYGQALAAMIVGGVAVAWAWRFLGRLQPPARE
ncbi:MAG: MATE family efflux transporter [Rhodobacteraceae bacterium]|nr:MATE family efflux transporter [Paracoccaceae bacterium]